MNSPLYLRAAECPVCFEQLAELTYLCETGHSFCQKCTNLLTVCPVCKQQMSTQINHTLQAVLKEVVAIKHSSEVNNNATHKCIANEECPLYLRAAECPVCDGKLAEPIYLCETGHSFCQQCTNLLTVCPVCNQQMSIRRNYTLEAVLEEVVALRLGIVNNNATHQCIVNEECHYHGNLKQLRSHLKKHHKDNIVSFRRNKFTFTINRIATLITTKILFYDRNIFKLCIKIDRKMAYFHMQMVECTGGHCDYAFELDYLSNLRKNKFYAKVFKFPHVPRLRSGFLRIPTNLFSISKDYTVYGRFYNLKRKQ